MRRALVVGSQTGELRGPDNDARAMAALLTERDFTVDLRTGERATRAGILAGYDALIASTKRDDVAVVYYAGHAFLGSIAADPGRAWQCIAPTDVNEGSVSDWRGITAWELSI